MGSMLLLTDGRVLVHEEPNCGTNGPCPGNDFTAWYTLTPDNTGSYIKGTWTKVASLPNGYAPLFFGSAVLPDGKVVIQGGEYQCVAKTCSEAWQALGALYDPVKNTWTSTTPPFNHIGDAQSVVLPDGTWMLADCCAMGFGDGTFPLYAYFNEATLDFTAKSNSSDGKFDEFDEEGWMLLPNGKLLTVDAYTSAYNAAGMNSELYDPSTNAWTSAGSTLVQLWDSCNGQAQASYEVGPAVLRPDGTVFATGSSTCQAGHTAVYNPSTGVWTAGPDFPSGNAANDAPAALEPNGNVIVMASPNSPKFAPPSNFYEWDGTSLTAFPNPSNASNDGSFHGHLLVLPTGQILFTDYTADVEVLTPAGTYNPAWQPTITSSPFFLTAGQAYPISGTQFNGLSQGAAYGDDFQDATNYPLVRIVNNGTSHVFYARTHGHSTMGLQTGAATVSTNFDVPAGIETGPCQLYVVANGIPSAASACNVGPTPTTTTLKSDINPSTVGQTVTFTATITPKDSPTATGTVAFTSNGLPIAGCNAVAVTAASTAQCPTNALPQGNDSIVAKYTGDANYQGSSSSPYPQVVNPSSVGVSITPAGMDFGDVQIDTRVKRSVTLKNTGSTTLAISSIQLVNAGGPPDFASVFALTYNCPASLHAGRSCLITVTLFDDQAEMLDAEVDVTDNDPSSPQRIPLTANVTNVDIGFKPASLKFAAITVGNSETKTVILTNLSNTTMTLNSIAFTGTNAADFSQTNNCPAPLQPNASCKAIVKFTPGGTGSRVAGMMVTANGGSTQQTLPLSGTGN
jgi:hypothetical protein